MAKVSSTPPETSDPLIGLTDEARAHLESIAAELDEAEKDLDAMDEIGVDSSRLRERIEWGRKAREVILKRLGERKV